MPETYPYLTAKLVTEYENSHFKLFLLLIAVNYGRVNSSQDEKRIKQRAVDERI